MFQGLYILALQPDGTTEAVPDLAESMEVNEDATVFTFKIRQGVMFQPPVSREVKAQDFVDSWSYNAQAKNKSATTYIIAPMKGIDPETGYADGPVLSGVKALDDYTLEVTLQYPFADFYTTLVHPITHVFPVDYAEEIGRKAFFDKPVGTGPYMVEEWKHNQYVTLTQWADYWNKDGASENSAGPGYVPTINMPIYNDDEHRVARLPEGRHRLLAHPDGQLQGRPERPQDPGRHLDRRGLPEHVRVLHQRRDEQAHARRRREPADPRRPQHGGRPRSGQQHRQRGHLDPLGLDLSRSRSPATRPGSTRTRTHRTRRRPSSTSSPAPCRARSRTGSTRAPATTRSPRPWSAGWQKAMPSLKFKLSGVETNSYWTQAGENKFDGLVRMGWIADYASIDNFIYLFTTEGGKYGSYSWYSNPEVDKLFKEARSTTDQTERFNLYNEAEKLILTDAPCVPGLHLPRRPRDQQPHRRVHLQRVHARRHVGRVGQVGPRQLAPSGAAE